MVPKEADGKERDNYGQAQDGPVNQSSALLEPRTQVIELCDHYEYYSDNEVQVGDDNDDETKKPQDIEIPAEESVCGYASGPENLEHSSMLPMLDPYQPVQP